MFLRRDAHIIWLVDTPHHRRFLSVISNRSLRPLLRTHITHPTHTEHHVQKQQNSLNRVFPLYSIAQPLSLLRPKARWKMTGSASSLLPVDCLLGVREVGAALRVLLAASGVEVLAQLLSTRGGRVYCLTFPVHRCRQMSLWLQVRQREVSQYRPRLRLV